MATDQPTLSNADAARRSQSPKSHGRGGAGNINSEPSVPVAANDLQTPSLKSTTYTTGRGGKYSVLTAQELFGNCVSNGISLCLKAPATWPQTPTLKKPAKHKTSKLLFTTPKSRRARITGVEAEKGI